MVSGSLTSALKKAAFATPFVFALAANVNAQTPPTIEPTATDLTKPVGPACVKTTPGQPGLSAWDKLIMIMDARGQIVIGSGNQLVAGNQKRELILTTAYNGKEGYIIDSAAPKSERKESSGFCLMPLKAVSAYNAFTSTDIPPPLKDKGQLGVAIQNNHNAGLKVVMIGVHTQGSLVVVNYDPTSGRASMKGSDYQGNRARDEAYMQDFAYGKKALEFFQTSSSDKTDPPSVVALAPTPK